MADRKEGLPEPLESPRTLLIGTKLHELSTRRSVLVLRYDSTVEQALKTLAGAKVLSAPVVSAQDNGTLPGKEWTATQQGAQEIVGFIDIKDILSSFLKEPGMEQIMEAKMLQRMRLLEEKGMQFANKQLDQLAVLGADGSFLYEHKQSKLTLMELVYDGFLYPGETRTIHGETRPRDVVHRVALFDKEGKITSVISQSDVIRFLAMNSTGLGAAGNKTVAQLGWASKEVISVPPEKPAIEAMALMDQKGISALAVVSSAGKIIGNFSVSEMRTIMSEHFGALALPVGEYLALEHGTEYRGYAIGETGMAPSSVVDVGHVPPRRTSEEHNKLSHDRAAQFVRQRERRAPLGSEVGQVLITCTRSETLRTVLERLVQFRLHRLYVVDEEERPIGVITLTDVLRCVVEERG